MNCRFLLINFFLTWRLHYNALIFKFNQLFGLYQYVCMACCNCKIIFLFIFNNLMGDLVNFFFICVILVSFSVGTYTPTLYTRWSWSPGRKLLLGLRQTITWVIFSIKIQCTEESYDLNWFYFRGKGQQSKCNFWIKDQSHLYQQIYLL